MAERKIFNYVSNILVQKTLDEEGYHPDKLGKTSTKFIWATCRYCGQPSRTRKGQFNKSGSACHKRCRIEEQKIAGSPFKDKAVKEKARKTNLERYGSEHANQNKDVAKRISEGRKKAQKKIEKTNVAHYGVKNPFQSEEIKSKIRETNQKKYGVDHAMQSSTIQEKTKKTLIQRYGVTNLQHYGPFHDSMKQTWKQRVESNEDGQYILINILRSEAFWKEIESGSSLRDVCQYFNLPYQSVASTINRDEFKEKFRSLYTYPKTQQQREIYNFIRSHGLNVLFNDRTIIGKELDIVVPDYKLAIEFNGSYWHSEAHLDTQDARKKHIDKLNLCRSVGFRLLNIFEHNWQERKLQFLNLISNILHIKNKNIAARKCLISNRSSKQFIEEHHIQGYPPRIIRHFNLEYEGQIIASMTASLHHRQNSSEAEVILSRLCFASGTNVQGGASKLFKYFAEWAHKEGYKTIKSWSDNCWTEGNIYKVLGFNLDKEYPPDYFYWDMKNKCYVNKQSQQKKKTGCPEGVTEREWCIRRGLYRIWDCGKKKWIYTL